MFPIVLYNGEYRWKVATNIHDLFHPVPNVLKPYQPQLSYFLIDEGTYSDDSLAERRSAVSAVFSLENARTLADAQQALRRMFTAIKGLPEKNRLDKALSYWVKRHLLRRMPNVIIPETDYLLENVDMLATNIERWYEQAHRSGVAEGISQGISQGIGQGISQGKGQLLTYLLSMKFPNVNLDAYRTNIDNAAEDAILRYSARVLTANTIEEVFYDASHFGS